jgi:hypothetical protein
MSAAMKRAPEPTPAAFPSAERATLAAAILAAAGADTRKAALIRAVATADDEVRAARRADEATAEAVETAQGAAAKHRVDTAMGVAGEAPMTVREARAMAIEAADDLQACLEAREALKVELAAEQGRPDFARMRVEECAKAVIKVEMQQRAIALAAEVAALQQKLVSRGSALEWLSRAGVFPERNGAPADETIRHTITRLERPPAEWEIGAIRYATSVFEPTGRLKWEAALERLKIDANATLD